MGWCFKKYRIDDAPTRWRKAAGAQEHDFFGDAVVTLQEAPQAECSAIVANARGDQHHVRPKELAVKDVLTKQIVRVVR